MSEKRKHEKAVLERLAKKYNYITRESDSCLVAHKSAFPRVLSITRIKLIEWLSGSHRVPLPVTLEPEFEQIEKGTIYPIRWLLADYIYDDDGLES